MSGAVASRTSAVAGLVSYYSGAPASRARDSEIAALVTVQPPGSRTARTGEIAALVTYARNPVNVPRTSEIAGLVTYSTAAGSPERSLAWTFTLDGHTFYVLDLGAQGTFLYDIDTHNWCEFGTQGYGGWNVRNGTMWVNDNAPRVVGGDQNQGYVWELDPDQPLDEIFRDIEHAVTGGLMMRSRNFASMATLRLAGSTGGVQDTSGAAVVELSYSDDDGQTYSTPQQITLTVGTTPDGSQDIRWDALGAFMAPGRIIQIADTGGLLRIDGLDAMLENYDDDTEKGQPSEGVIE